jgi:glucosamine--fructose-6-phosphate aminotransferase (isomerizing)
MQLNTTSAQTSEVFLSEVLDQPRALRVVLNHYLHGLGRESMSAAARLCREAKRGPAFVGMGSSYYAPLVSMCILNSQAAPSQVWEAGELLYYYMGGLSSEQVLVAVSQSGQTIEVRKVVSAMRGKMPVIGVTNNEDSWLAENCDVVLPMLAGTETMSTSKTYVNTLAILSVLAWQTAKRFDKSKEDQLLAVPSLLENELRDWETRMGSALELLGHPSFLHLVSRGPSYSTALQAQVILKEGAYLLTEAQTGASFRHGPFEIIDQQHRAMVLAAKGPTYEITINLVRDMAAVGSKILLVTNAKPIDPIKNVHVYLMPDVEEYILPMLNIVPVETLLILLARQRGMEPGAITKGNKVTINE